MSISQGPNCCLKEFASFRRKIPATKRRLLEGGGGLKRYLAECCSNMDYPCQGLPSVNSVSAGQLSGISLTVLALFLGSSFFLAFMVFFGSFSF